MIACDVLVVGAGPAGMAAAAAAAENGRRVCLLDQNAAAGGQIWRGYHEKHAANEPHGQVFAGLMGRLRSAGLAMRSEESVVAAVAQRVLRVESESRSEDIGYEQLILATGARERFLPFPGWTLPGVTGVGGLQALVKAGLPIAGKRVVLAGSGPLLLAVAAGLAKRGARIEGIFEQAPLSRLIRLGAALVSQPSKIAEGLRYRVAVGSASLKADAWVTRGHGSDRLVGVTVKVGGKERALDCDYLGCSFHLIPNLELPLLLGCRVERGSAVVDGSQMSSVDGIYCAGELTGIGGLDKALVEGEIAGLAAAGRPVSHLLRQRAARMRFAKQLDETFAPRPELRALAEATTLVCRCEDVPHAALSGMRSWREAKLHTRCGMDACQGRICGPATAAIFGWEHDSVRPPLLPARVGSLAVPPPSVQSS